MSAENLRAEAQRRWGFVGKEFPKSAQGYPGVFAKNRDLHVEDENP